MEKEKKPGKGLKIFAVLLLILSLGLIGSGVYLMFIDNNKEEVVEEDTPIEEEVDETTLDVTSDEVLNLVSSLKMDKITNPLVSEEVKDFYFTKDSINDDLKLFLALVSMDDVVNYNPTSTDTVEFDVSKVEEKVNLLFNEGRVDTTYKNMNLGDGVQAIFNSETNKYSLSNVATEVTDLSKYYTEIISATKVENELVLVFKTYYVSVEDSDNNPETPSIYKIYKDSSKSELLIESEYEALPNISELNIEENKFINYQFVFTQVEDTYKLSLFSKIEQ